MKQRVLDFLAREARAEKRDGRERELLPLEDRIAEGSALAGLSLVANRNGVLVYQAPSNASKLRAGDACWLSDGDDIRRGVPCRIHSHDPLSGRISVEQDRYAKKGGSLPRERAVLDRRSLELGSMLTGAVKSVLESKLDGDCGWILDALEGRIDQTPHGQRLRRAQESGLSKNLNPGQRRAFEAAASTRQVCLVQGPPGTGKTLVAAAVIVEALRAGERVLVSGFTHRAIDNVLVQAARAAGSPRSIFKIGQRGDATELRRADIARVRHIGQGHLRDGEGIVVGATAFGAGRLRGQVRFDVVLLDEAGQMPIPHAIAALAAGGRAVLVGDHKQLGPVVVNPGTDPDFERSIFAHLAEVVPSKDVHLLSETYRMNQGICDFPSRLFYGGRLVPADTARDRRLRLRPGGRYREILDPKAPSIIVEVAHRGRRGRAPEEARAVACLVRELVFHHAMSPSDLAIVTPYRAHANAVREALATAIPEGGGAVLDGLVVDTADRLQGQEREVVIYTFGTSDPDTLNRNGGFLFDPGRLNVGLTRARTKRIIVGAPAVARARPRDVEGLRRAALVQQLWREGPRVPWND